MKAELRDLIIRLQVSNARAENLMDNIYTAKRLLKQYENCLIKELKTSDELADKVKLELLLEDAEVAQIENMSDGN